MKVLHSGTVGKTISALFTSFVVHIMLDGSIEEQTRWVFGSTGVPYLSCSCFDQNMFF